MSGVEHTWAIVETLKQYRNNPCHQSRRDGRQQKYEHVKCVVSCGVAAPMQQQLSKFSDTTAS